MKKLLSHQTSLEMFIFWMFSSTFATTVLLISIEAVKARQ